MNQFTDRRYVFAAAIILVGLVFIFRLFQIQVVDKSYEKYALSNSYLIAALDKRPIRFLSSPQKAQNQE